MSTSTFKLNDGKNFFAYLTTEPTPWSQYDVIEHIGLIRYAKENDVYLVMFHDKVTMMNVAIIYKGGYVSIVNMPDKCEESAFEFQVHDAIRQTKKEAEK